MCQVDNEGRCAKHNFVQVMRQSRSGEWKSLLEVCPLCAMDEPGGANDNSTALVPVASSSSPAEERRSFRVKFAKETDGIEVRKDYQFRLPSSSNLQSSIDSSDRSIVSCSSAQSAQRSALKSPKYKVCPKKMKEQSDLEVTTMSMDLNLEIEDSESESESENEAPEQLRAQPSPPKRTPPPPPRRQSRHKEEKSKVNPRVIGKSPVRANVRRSTNSSSSNEAVRPDPVEYDQNTMFCTQVQAPHEDNSFANGSGPFIMTRDVSDDVSAISFMGSVYSNQSNFNALVPIPDIDEESHQKPNDFDFDNDDEIPNSTNNFDSKGRCKTHPHVKLRKKKFLGRGWKVLMSACPDCCVDELRRLHAKKKSIDDQKQLPKQAPPPPPARKPAPRNSIKDKESDDTASLSNSSQGSIQAEQVQVVQNGDQDGIYVKDMAWTDRKGRRGSYTGEVDTQLIPNGKGSIRYGDETVKEGEWKNGERSKSSSGRSRARASDRASRSRSVSTRPGSRSRSTSVTPKTRARSSSRARVAPEF